MEGQSLSCVRGIVRGESFRRAFCNASEAGRANVSDATFVAPNFTRYRAVSPGGARDLQSAYRSDRAIVFGGDLSGCDNQQDWVTHRLENHPPHAGFPKGWLENRIRHAGPPGRRGLLLGSDQIFIRFRGLVARADRHRHKQPVLR